MRFTLFIAITIITISSNAQALKQHLWKDRVVLVISANKTSKLTKKQLNLFSSPNEEFIDRKLIVYRVHPNTFKKANTNTWTRSSDLYTTYNSSKQAFRVVLIGLDGTIKIDKNSIITTEALFSKIDAMPMRRSKTRNR